jgi:hypothetical protein
MVSKGFFIFFTMICFVSIRLAKGQFNIWINIQNKKTKSGWHVGGVCAF